jgi:hypothetical protein
MRFKSLVSNLWEIFQKFCIQTTSSRRFLVFKALIASISSSIVMIYRVELCYNVVKWTEYFVSLYMSVVLNE